MKKKLAILLCAVLLFGALSPLALAKSGKLDADVAAETRALAVEI